MAHPVVHFEIGASDTSKAHKFYGDLFDWNIQVHDEMQYGLVNAEGKGSIGGGIGSAPPDGKPYVTFYVQVDDLQACLDKAVKLGGKQVLPPTPIPGMGSFAWFSDPDGNMIGLYKNG
jgi:predicted enzyme related to lactoylglutathione lyase